MITLNIEEALQEMKEKSYRQVQSETAIKWAGRAGAAFQSVLEVPHHEKLIYWSLGEEYEHEAIEHAALVEDETGLFVKEIQLAIKPYQDKAVELMDAIFGVSGADEVDQQPSDSSDVEELPVPTDES